MFVRKTGFSLCALALMALSVSALAKPRVEALQPAAVDVLPDHVFAPMGFDDNDNVQVVLDGALNDTCYKLGPTLVRVDHQAHRVVLRQQAYYYPGGWCMDVRIPYVQTVNLGILKAGEYQVVVERPDNTVATTTALPIAIATTASPDDFLYAPVTDVRIERRNSATGTTAKADVIVDLSGVFSNSCMKFREATVIVRPTNVIEVLPVVDLKAQRNCAQVTTEFTEKVTLKGITSGRYLIHVRSLNGQAVNRVVDL